VRYAVDGRELDGSICCQRPAGTRAETNARMDWAVAVPLGVGLWLVLLSLRHGCRAVRRRAAGRAAGRASGRATGRSDAAS